jgi:hypothetical protein
MNGSACSAQLDSNSLHVLPPLPPAKTYFTATVQGRVRWESRYEALANYQQAHSHCVVSSKESFRLRQWVNSQRHARRTGKLSAERVRRLDELGFVWDVRQVRWASMFEDLAAYQRAHGHCDVPSNKDCIRLWRWVVTQRVARRKGKLNTDQVRRLDTLGFIWGQHEEQWARMLVALVEYKRAYGNCDVPRAWPPNPKLGVWVDTQRQFNRMGRLPPHRRERLEELGFRFSCSRSTAIQPHPSGLPFHPARLCQARLNAPPPTEAELFFI